MKKNILLILFFVVLLVYIIFFPHQLKKELVFNPSWGIEITDVSGGTDDNPVPFSFDSKLGYFSAAGRLLYSEDIGYKAAVSEALYVNYSSVSENLVLKEPDGRISGIIETEGLPFFIGDRFFVISPDRMEVTEYSYDGTPLLKLSPGSVITSMDAGSDKVILGMLNGEVSVYNGEPEPVFTYFSTDSRYSVTYACALTNDGERFAAVTGLEPQQLVCFELRNGEWVAVFRMNMKNIYRRNLLLDYSDDGKLLYLENPAGIEIYSTATFLKKTVDTEGIITNAVFPGDKDMSYIVSSGAEHNFLKIYRADLGVIADFRFPEGDFYFYPEESCFYIGVGGKLLRYDLIEG